MSWGPDAEEAIFRLFDRGWPANLVIKHVKQAFGTSVKPIRKTLAGLEAVNAEEHGDWDARARWVESFKGYGGTDPSPSKAGSACLS